MDADEQTASNPHGDRVNFEKNCSKMKKREQNEKVKEMATTAV